jgi:hypothetical protein
MMEANKVDRLLRAAGAATGQARFVLVGSATIFAWEDMVPSDMSQTREIDLFAYDVDRETAENISAEIDGALGHSSQFDETYGYYCDGVGPDTAILPIDWEARSMLYSSPATNGVTAIVPHPNDIAVAKLCAGREKDMIWLRAAVRSAIIDPAAMREVFRRLPRERAPAQALLEERLNKIERR